MIMPYDSDYQETKQIMLGNTVMKPEFKKLAEWVDQTYQVKTINVIFDTIDEGKRPRLQLCFEFENEVLPFYDKDNINYHRDTQQLIKEKLTQSLIEDGLLNKGEYFTDNLWVIYGSFKPIAMMEANGKITKDELEGLKQKINSPDLWEISNNFSGAFFFVYTDKQVKHYKNSESEQKWAELYFDLLEKYNQFGYFKRETFSIYLDSKENFDTNYASNWYYYYK